MKGRGKSKTDVMSRQRGKVVRFCPQCADGELENFTLVKGISSKRKMITQCASCKFIVK